MGEIVGNDRQTKVQNWVEWNWLEAKRQICAGDAQKTGEGMR